MQRSWHELTWRDTLVYQTNPFLHHYLFAMSLSALKVTSGVGPSTLSVIPLLIQEHRVANTSGTSLDRTSSSGSEGHRLWRADNGYHINTKAATTGDKKFSNLMFREVQQLSPCLDCVEWRLKCFYLPSDIPHLAFCCSQTWYSPNSLCDVTNSWVTLRNDNAMPSVCMEARKFHQC